MTLDEIVLIDGPEIYKILVDNKISAKEYVEALGAKRPLFWAWLQQNPVVLRDIISTVEEGIKNAIQPEA